jgi:hypothetical protein
MGLGILFCEKISDQHKTMNLIRFASDRSNKMIRYTEIEAKTMKLT